VNDIEKENFYGIQQDFDEDEYQNEAFVIDEDEDFNPEGEIE
jgi:hypothetical protein